MYPPMKDVSSRIPGLKELAPLQLGEKHSMDRQRLCLVLIQKNFDIFAGDRQAKTTVIDTSDPECHARGTI